MEHMDNEKIKLTNTIDQLKKSITALEIEQTHLRSTLNRYFTDIEDQKKIFQSTIQEQQQALTEKQFIIEHLAFAVLALKISKPWVFIKNAIRPHLYRLNQYNPRKLHIPNNYVTQKNNKITPTISIVTPSFNQGMFLESTIKSVVEQNYPALEYIIQDNASSDNSVDIIKRYDKQLRFWESNKDKSQANALNLGFRHATGDIMAYLNSDDILLPGALAYVANYFAAHPEVDVVYGHRIVINENNKEIGRWVLPPHDSNMLLWADYIPQETLFWRRKIWEKAGGCMDENFQFALDWDLLLRFKSVGAKFVRLPRFLGGFRFHAQQKTSSNMATTGKTEMDILRKRCHGKYVSHRKIKKNIKNYLIKHIIFYKLYRLGLLKY